MHPSVYAAIKICTRHRSIWFCSPEITLHDRLTVSIKQGDLTNLVLTENIFIYLPLAKYPSIHVDLAQSRTFNRLFTRCAINRILSNFSLCKNRLKNPRDSWKRKDICICMHVIRTYQQNAKALANNVYLNICNVTFIEILMSLIIVCREFSHRYLREWNLMSQGCLTCTCRRNKID